MYRLSIAAGLLFAGLMAARVFGTPIKRAILDDPYGKLAAIETQIRALRADSDSAAIRTIEILDTLARGGE